MGEFLRSVTSTVYSLMTLMILFNKILILTMLATGCTQSQQKSIYFNDAYTDSNKKTQVKHVIQQFGSQQQTKKVIRNQKPLQEQGLQLPVHFGDPPRSMFVELEGRAGGGTFEFREIPHALHPFACL